VLIESTDSYQEADSADNADNADSFKGTDITDSAYVLTVLIMLTV
jgi:hypothetical protein